MNLLTFKSGVHPPHGKELSQNMAIETYLPTGNLVFPMAQHIGAPCAPLVAKGDKVLVGQKIGEANGFGLSVIHSSVSGTVKAIGPVMTAAGTKVNAITIENDGEYTPAFDMNMSRDYKGMSKDEIVNIIKDAGIVGLGGACFPTHVKLTPPKDAKIDTIILNGAECEPYLTCDYRMMMEQGEKIVKGLDIILQLFPGAHGYIGIEDNKKDAISNMAKICGSYKNIEVCALRTKYPQGAEKQLIDAITKRKVPGGQLPSSVGCVVQNVGTAAQVFESVVCNKPLIQRVVTITGGAIKNPKNLLVNLGTSVNELIDYCGGFKEDPIKVISGGPMMGMTMSTTDVPLTKGGSGVLCMSKAEALLPKASACIRCGKCIGVCPMNLLPLTLRSVATRGASEDFEKLNGFDCIECGCCSFICPAKIQLLQAIRMGKKQTMVDKAKKIADAKAKKEQENNEQTK